MTPIEACGHRARVLRCAQRMIARRDRRLAHLQARLVTIEEADRVAAEFDEHERRMAMLRAHFDALGEIAMRGRALLH